MRVFRRGGTCMPAPPGVYPRLDVASVDAVVMHASAKSSAVQAAKEAGWTAARAERAKRMRCWKDVPDRAACRCVPFAVETCGCMGRGRHGP